jgi:hypothetical protein
MSNLVCPGAWGIDGDGTGIGVGRDDTDAVDQSNVIDERTRDAKPSGWYCEPGDEQGLPGGEDGTGVGAQ